MPSLSRPLRAGIGLAVVGAVAAYRAYGRLAARGERVLHRRPGPEVLDPYDVVERVPVPGAVLSHDELPLEDYDHLTIGSLRARIRALTPVELVQLRDYERAHANRLPVLTLFENRLKSLATTS